jgi:hypothetical protein
MSLGRQIFKRSGTPFKYIYFRDKSKANFRRSLSKSEGRHSAHFSVSNPGGMGAEMT